MSNQYLVSNLVTAIRDAGMLSGADETAQTTRLLGFLNREQRLYLMRLMLSVRESYRVAIVDVTLTAGRTAYPVPTRAVGAKLKLLQHIDASGVPGATLYPIDTSAEAASSRAGGPGDYTVRNNSIIFRTAPTGGTYMRIHYFRRFNKMVPASEASGAITAIDTATGIVTVSIADNAMPSGFTTSVTYDLIQGRPHFDLLAADLAASAVGASSLTFDPAALPSGLAVGDFVALSGESPICQAPVELHDVLVYRALQKYLESQGDARSAAIRDDLKEMRDNAMALMSPRVEDTPPTLQNFDAPGWNRFRSRTRST